MTPLAPSCRAAHKEASASERSAGSIQFWRRKSGIGLRSRTRKPLASLPSELESWSASKVPRRDIWVEFAREKSTIKRLGFGGPAAGRRGGAPARQGRAYIWPRNRRGAPAFRGCSPHAGRTKGRQTP